MATISVHLFTTEAEAQAAVVALNAHHGIPVSPDAETQNYEIYQRNGELDQWYINISEGTINVLGFDEIEEIEIEDEFI
jgi:hypothetical protein